MISDVLADAVAEIEEYLDEPVYDQVYHGKLRARIIALKDAMEAMRVELDTPPQTER